MGISDSPEETPQTKLQLGELETRVAFDSGNSSVNNSLAKMTDSTSNPHSADVASAGGAGAGNTKLKSCLKPGTSTVAHDSSKSATQNQTHPLYTEVWTEPNYNENPDHMTVLTQNFDAEGNVIDNSDNGSSPASSCTMSDAELVKYADFLRQKANTDFKGQKYPEAIRGYTLALKVLELDVEGVRWAPFDVKSGLVQAYENTGRQASEGEVPADAKNGDKAANSFSTRTMIEQSAKEIVIDESTTESTTAEQQIHSLLTQIRLCGGFYVDCGKRGVDKSKASPSEFLRLVQGGLLKVSHRKSDDLAKLHSNRAAAYFALGHFKEAACDGQQSMWFSELPSTANTDAPNTESANTDQSANTESANNSTANNINREPELKSAALIKKKKDATPPKPPAAAVYVKGYWHCQRALKKLEKHDLALDVAKRARELAPENADLRVAYNEAVRLVKENLDDYEIDEKEAALGTGNFCTVYRATSVKTGHSVALKVFDRESIKHKRKMHEIVREQDILWRMNHPNIIKVHAFWTDQSSAYVSLPYLKSDLFEIVKKCGLCENGVRYYFAQVLSGVSYLHANYILHRDLKCENILVDGGLVNGTIKIIDFGTARDLKKPVLDKQIEDMPTRRGFAHYVGTPQFMSPECVANAVCSYPSDVYSLGCVLFQMISGLPPFQAGSEYLVLLRVQNRDCELPPGFSPLTIDMIERCLRVKEQERPQLAEIRDHPWWVEDRLRHAVHELRPAADNYSGTIRGVDKKGDEFLEQAQQREQTEGDFSWREKKGSRCSVGSSNAGLGDITKAMGNSSSDNSGDVHLKAEQWRDRRSGISNRLSVTKCLSNGVTAVESRDDHHAEQYKHSNAAFAEKHSKDGKAGMLNGTVLEKIEADKNTDSNSTSDPPITDPYANEEADRMMFHTPRYSEWFEDFDFENEEQKRVMSLEERADRERANLLRNFCVRDCGSGAAETWIPGGEKGKKESARGKGSEEDRKEDETPEQKRKRREKEQHRVQFELRPKRPYVVAKPVKQRIPSLAWFCMRAMVDKEELVRECKRRRQQYAKILQENSAHLTEDQRKDSKKMHKRASENESQALFTKLAKATVEERIAFCQSKNNEMYLIDYHEPHLDHIAQTWHDLGRHLFLDKMERESRSGHGPNDRMKKYVDETQQEADDYNERREREMQVAEGKQQQRTVDGTIVDATATPTPAVSADEVVIEDITESDKKDSKDGAHTSAGTADVTQSVSVSAEEGTKEGHNADWHEQVHLSKNEKGETVIVDPVTGKQTVVGSTVVGAAGKGAAGDSSFSGEVLDPSVSAAELQKILGNAPVDSGAEKAKNINPEEDCRDSDGEHSESGEEGK